MVHSMGRKAAPGTPWCISFGHDSRPLTHTSLFPPVLRVRPLWLSPACIAASHLEWQGWSLQTSSRGACAEGLLVCVSVAGKREEGIQNTPKEGYGKNLTKNIPSYGDMPWIPLTALFRIRILSTNVRLTKEALFFHSTQCLLCVKFSRCALLFSQHLSLTVGLPDTLQSIHTPSKLQSDTCLSRLLVWHKGKRSRSLLLLLLLFKKISSYNFCSSF